MTVDELIEKVDGLRTSLIAFLDDIPDEAVLLGIPSALAQLDDIDQAIQSGDCVAALRILTTVDRVCRGAQGGDA